MKHIVSSNMFRFCFIHLQGASGTSKTKCIDVCQLCSDVCVAGFDHNGQHLYRWFFEVPELLTTFIEFIHFSLSCGRLIYDAIQVRLLSSRVLHTHSVSNRVF